mmetsp:Transcript_29760/g.83142  ORF Transcript_29760/g.83142 Transcript_29760/m.83142 type:complete len:317 (+) Transcript_29760:86-1036(+)|eukprot:CAMPEP_0119131160 /NCGR_PEP_ID=MMETSP1310-20130426/9631_1 /TAXON_ID=464262 /ORGANISM="Genus nov. species nov., Strain RCC2339" /LENGTH=316 /DNA_ID=CAMNT_0007121713 /DNA_START=78 /DNA_END=1028 /DNA_ORIENTATION=-
MAAADINFDALSNELESTLKKANVKDFPRPKEVVEFPSSNTPIDCFTVLTEKRILSAPVYDAESKEYIGFVDLRDLVSYVINAEKSIEFSHNSLKDIIAYVPKVAKVDVTLSYLARRHRFHRVSIDATLLDVARALASSKTHRVPVFENDKIVNIISQSTIIAFLAKSLKDMPNVTGANLGKLKIGSSPVIQCSASTPARNAFEILENTGRFGMAVTGEGNTIITQTSAHDLKLWLRNPSSEMLGLPIIQFLQRIRSQDLDIQVPVLSCSEKDSLGMVLLKLQATRAHRIYVLDAQFHPKFVVSLSDVLRLLIHKE